LIAIDLDGTLLDSLGGVSEANRRAIGLAIERGIEIVVATGRRYDFARPVLEPLAGPLTLVLSNGAVIKTREGSTELLHLLPRAVARRVLEQTAAWREGASVLFDRPRERQVVYERIDWAHPRRRRYFETNRAFLAEHAPLEACLTEDPVQVMFTGGYRDMRALFAQLERDANGEYAVTLTEYEHRDFSLVDVLRAGCSKGAALADWVGRRGLRPEQVMAIGDNLNDLDMLAFAGRPVVMGNAVEELKARGWPVTRTHDQAGVAAAIEEFVFGR
jgi:Cof subfamily protein (haloacid dehalogenase superfamily)